MTEPRMSTRSRLMALDGHLASHQWLTTYATAIVFELRKPCLPPQ